MSLLLRGIGTAVPPYCIEQRDALEQAMVVYPATEHAQRLVPAVYRRSGVQTRHVTFLTSSSNSAPAGQTFYTPAADAEDRGPTTGERMQRYAADAAVLGCHAARRALAEADLPAAAITHLVTVSCSGFSAPGFDLQMMAQLGMSCGAARSHLGYMGCHGALNGLRVARAFAQSDPQARVLLCAVELCSLHHQYSWHPDAVVANALFADGAAAVVVQSGQHAGGLHFTASGSTVVPDTADAMSWTIGDHGFAMTLSATVPEIIGSRLRPWLQSWLREQGLELADVGGWGVHPGGPRILQACQQALGLEPGSLAVSREILARYGNMSSPTVLFILDVLRQTNVPRPYVLLAFGPGLAIEAALVR